VFLATKVAPRNFRRHDLIAAAEGSLRRLGTEFIDLYQLHWPNYRIPIEETMGAMEDLVDAGKVRFVGVSNFSISEVKAARAASRVRILSIQVQYNLIERSAEEGLLAYCQQNKITLIAHSPFGKGLPRIQAQDPQKVLDRIACRSRKTCAQISLNWLIAKENVVAIPRSSSAAHVVENCQASGWRLSSEEYGLLDAKIQSKRRGRFGSTLRRWKRYFDQSIGRQL
jgi:diketogulonate reductase-like aldo/keto reductase